MSIPISFHEECEGDESIHRAMADARAAQIAWADAPLKNRLKLVRALRALIAERGADLAAASAAARNRPPFESLTAEVLPLAEAAKFLERQAEKILAPHRLGWRGRPLWLNGVRTEIRREALGVVLIIGPGNYPLLLPGIQLLQALAAGNAVLLKPGAGGGPVAELLRELVAQAGFDRRLLAVLPETDAAARAAIAAQPEKVLFTGSARTGQQILHCLAPCLIPATMELSGCDSVIVLPSADLDLLTRALIFGLTLNAGKTCLAPRRLFVTGGMATELEGRLAQAFARLHPAQVIEGGAADGVRLLIENALASGAHLVAGSAVRLPAVLAGVPPSARLLQEDTFAPVLSIVTVADEAEAVRLSNNCPYALGASVFTRDKSAGRRVAAQLNAGFVSINDLIVPSADPRVPFGGRAASGFGATRGAEGLLELTTAKVISVSGAKFRPAFDAPRPRDEQLIQSHLKLAHGRGFGRRWRALAGILSSVFRRHETKQGKAT